MSHIAKLETKYDTVVYKSGAKWYLFVATAICVGNAEFKLF